MSQSVVCRAVRGLLACVGVAALAACTAMPLTSMVRLARTDFTAVDPAALRVALKLPEEVRPRPHGVRLRLTSTVDGAKETQEFVLANLADAGELVTLRGAASAGTAVYGFRLDSADVPRLVALRSDMLARKSRGGHGALTLGVSADGCRTGPLPGTILLTTYLRTEPGGDFFPLARDVDLRKVIPSEDLAAKIPPCE